MFYNYEIKINNNEKILYLYLTMNYEFSNELNLNKIDDLTRRTKNFIKNNNIDYDGNKVYLVIDNIVVKSLLLNKLNEIELLNDNLYYSNEKYMVNIKSSNNIIYQITLGELLQGAIAYIYFEGMNQELIKAMSVLFRTYIYKCMKEETYILENNDYFNFRPISYYKLLWIKNYNDIIKLINISINKTDCMFVTYNNNYILPFYHFCNNGTTIKCKNIDYLISTTSYYDLTSPFYINVNKYSYKELSLLLKNKINYKSKFSFETDKNELIKRIIIDKIEYNVDKFIKILNLKSKLFKIILEEKFIIFITKGWGEFLGISLYGANELSKNNDFMFLINYYFQNIKFKKYIT